MIKKGLKALCAMFVIGVAAIVCSTVEHAQVLNTYIEQVSALSISTNTKIVGLGEATHGNKEFTELKKEVFETLVTKYGYHVFAIEGDFGGCQKVNDYIQNGTGTAKEAAEQIGFKIYKTKEMEALLQWMYEYNLTADNLDKIVFYGFDMQRYDNSKESLFDYLNKVDSSNCASYKQMLIDLNDETAYTQSKEKVKDGLAGIEALIQVMDSNKESFIQVTSEQEYSLAYHNLSCMQQFAIIRCCNVNYNDARDQYMAENIQWIDAYETVKGNDHMFITGHNGHIEKSSASLAAHTCMGKYLTQLYGEGYYAIGTDFYNSKFMANDSLGGGYKIFEVTNKSSDIIKAFVESGKEMGFLDFSKASKDKDISKLLNSKQPMGNVGNEFNSITGVLSSSYTIGMVPSQAYNALIIIKEVHPTTLFE